MLSITMRRKAKMSDFDEGLAAGLAIGKKKWKNGGGVSLKEWTYPAEWLQLPDPGEKEIYVLLALGSIRSIIHYDEYDGSDIYVNADGAFDCLIDWGDGTDNSSERNVFWHVYEYGTGYRLADGTELFIVKITVESGKGVYQIAGSIGKYSGIIAAKVHISALYAAHITSQMFKSPHYATLEYVKLFGDPTALSQTRSIFDNNYGLKKIEFEYQPTVLPETFLNGAGSLERLDFPEVVEVKRSALYYMHNIRYVNLPKLEKAGDHFMSNCYGDYLLNGLSFPKLSEVGEYAFYENYALTALNAPKLHTAGKSFCSYCPNLSSLVLSDSFDRSKFLEWNNNSINLSVLI